MKAGMLKEKRAKKAGTTSATGIANKTSVCSLASPDKVYVGDDKEFDWFI